MPAPLGATPLAPPPGATPLAPPPGATTIAQQPTPVQPVAQRKVYDHESLKKLWIQAGGDPDKADIMAHIAETESSGLVDNVNADSGTTGLWQINPSAHGAGNWTDPLTNAREAVKLYNARVARGQTGYEDWQDSRDKGNGGGWGQYLAGAPPPGAQPLAPPPGAQPLNGPPNIHAAAETTPSHRTPLPIPHVEGKNRPRNEDPRVARYNIAESLAGHLDLVPILANAAMWDRVDHTGGQHVAEAMNLWKPRFVGGKGNPGAAGALYGLNSPEALRMYQRSGNPVFKAYADYLLANPKSAGLITFAEEWFNPQSWVEGGLIGRTGKVVLPLAKKLPGIEPALNYMMHTMSLYKGIVDEHGVGPRNVLHTIGQRMSHASQQGHNAMMDVMGGFDRPAHREIVRRQQHLAPDTASFTPEQNAAIDKAAELKRKYTRDTTAALLASGALKKHQVSWVNGSAPTTLFYKGKKVGEFAGDPGTYHGLANQYNHPNAAYNALLEHLHSEGRTVAGGGAGKASSLKHKTHDNLDDAEKANHGLLKDDIDHADLFYNYMSISGKRVAFEEGMRELAARHPDVITSVPKGPQRDALISSGKYIPIADAKNSGISLPGNTGSPFMKQALISPAFRDFLSNKNALAAMLGNSMYDRGPQSKMAKWRNGFDSTYRAMILANPGYHPFWNVAPNAAAATGKVGPAGLAELMVNHTRALLGVGAAVSHAMGEVPVVGNMAKGVGRTLDAAREGLEDPFIRGAQSYQNAMHAALQAGATAKEAEAAGRSAAIEEAVHAGATAEFGATQSALGGSSGRIFGQPMRDPITGKFTAATAKEFFDQALTKIWDWNQQATFGARGEEAFAVTLYHQFTRKGGLFEGDPYAASWAVREALGNYRNMDPDNWMSKTMLFFPWLATNVPFWFKAFTKTPAFVTAPTMGSRVEREIAGDPSAYDPAHAHLGLSWYDPKTQTAHSVPYPFKDAEKFAQAGYDLITNDPENAGKLMIEEVASRAKPGWNALLDTFATTIDERAHPAGTYAGYNVMYDKNLPDQRNADLAKNFALDVLPLPAPFVFRDIIRNGYDPAKMSEYIQEAAGIGFITDKQADNFQAMQQRASQVLQAKMVRIRKAQSSAHPPTEDQINTYTRNAAKEYSDRMARIKAIIAESKKKRTGPPPGARPLNVPQNIAPVANPPGMIPITSR